MQQPDSACSGATPAACSVEQQRERCGRRMPQSRQPVGLLLRLLLLFAAGSATRLEGLPQHAFPVPAQLPPRSWGSVGGMAFAHLAKREGALNLTDAEFLARFQMVCFEKPTDEVRDGWAEDKMNAAARTVKRVRPEVWALRYINGLLDFTGRDTNFSLHRKAAALGLLWPPFHANLSTFDVTDQRMRALLVDGEGCYFLVFVPTVREIRDFYRDM
eukprot:SAG31_NODE_729_length_12511_cov_7.059293_1_plen_216_part_00